MDRKIEKVIVTDEYLAKIRGFAAIDPEEEFDYVPKVYREFPQELQPIFTLAPVGGEDLHLFSDEMRKDTRVNADGNVDVRVQRGLWLTLVAKKGIKSWKNYYTTEGVIIPWSGDIGPLATQLIEEIATVVTERARLTKEEILGLK